MMTDYNKGGCPPNMPPTGREENVFLKVQKNLLRFKLACDDRVVS